MGCEIASGTLKMMALPLENVSDSEEGQEDNGKPLVAQYRKQDLVGLVHWRSFLSSSRLQSRCFVRQRSLIIAVNRRYCYTGCYIFQ